MGNGMQNGLVYQPPDCSYYIGEYAGELIWVPRESEKKRDGIPCMLLQRPRAKWLLLYFHANAEDLGQIYLMLRYFRTFLQVHVLAVEYPGYGLCSGEPSERQVLVDAETVLQFVYHRLDVPLERVLVMGRSLGGVPAIHLASTFHDIGGLVTLSTFSSAASFLPAGDMARGFYGLVVGYDNEKRIRDVACRSLIIHGEEDVAIDVQHAVDLFEACGADVHDGDDTKRLETRPGMGHNNFDNKRDLIAPIKEFFPDLNDESDEVLELGEIEDILKEGPKKLAAEVIDRLPYSPERMENRHMLPFAKTKIISKDGQEI